MPASSIITYFQDTRNNFNAVKPSLCTEIAQPVGQCHNIHISTNCYYGYHSTKTAENVQNNIDCEMPETPRVVNGSSMLQAGSRKRCADNSDYPQSKRIREEGMVPSTTHYNPCLLRPTHNNPDISRCLMVHMI